MIKGEKMSDEQKRKLSATNKGNKGCGWARGTKGVIKANSGSFKKGHKRGMTGKRHTPEAIAKIKKSNRKKQGRKRIGTDGYIYVKTYEHPNLAKFGSGREIKEEVLAVEKYLGRYLDIKAVVHHINFNRTDNRLENLYIFKNPSEHTRFHSNVRWGNNVRTSLKSNLEQHRKDYQP